MTKKKKECEKGPQLSDKELMKWSKILGCDQIVRLYVDNKIYLNQEQLDKVVDMKHGEPKESNYERF